MSDGKLNSPRRGQTASTGVAVEVAIDFSRGANQWTWAAYRLHMADNISPWREGGFYAEEVASSQFYTEPTERI